VKEENRMLKWILSFLSP